MRRRREAGSGLLYCSAGPERRPADNVGCLLGLRSDTIDCGGKLPKLISNLLHLGDNHRNALFDNLIQLGMLIAASVQFIQFARYYKILYGTK